MKKYLIAIITLLALAPNLVSAHAGHMSDSGDMAEVATSTEATSTDMQLEMGNASVDAILSAIMAKQGVASPSQIDCQRVSQNDLETLGDAIMERMHPGEAHEFADQMMGGEGSDSLRAMHILLAKRYLGCATGGDYQGAFGMMMGDYDDMMGPGVFYGDDARKIDYFGWGGMAMGMVAFWVIAVGLLIWLAKILFGGGRNRAMSILAERYARGEISKSEYEKMKKELEQGNN